MTGLTNALPTDVDALQALILAERAAHAAEATRLRQIIKEMQRHRFGRRAETLPIDQLELGLEDVQQTEAAEAAAIEAKDPKRRSEAQALRRAKRGQLPDHLPRVETILDIEDDARHALAHLKLEDGSPHGGGLFSGIPILGSIFG